MKELQRHRRCQERKLRGLAPQRVLQPFFNGFGGFFAGSAERGRCRTPVHFFSSRACTFAPRGGQAARRGVAAGGGSVFSRIQPWHAHFACFPRVRARCEPHPARAKCGPMIRMSSGSSLAFQRLSRDTLPFILGVK
eukprot:gene21007-biopygen13159